MFFPDSFKVSTPSDREIQVTRDFDAPRRLVFDAFTRPELVRRWLLGPPGWTIAALRNRPSRRGCLPLCLAFRKGWLAHGHRRRVP